MSSSLSSSPSSPPRLDHSTLNLLDNFISQRSERQAKLHRIQMQATRHGVGEIKLTDSDEDKDRDQSVSQSTNSRGKGVPRNNHTAEKQEEDESSDDSGEEGDEQEYDSSEDERQELNQERKQREKDQEEEAEEEERLLEAEALADLERLVQLEYEESLQAGGERGPTPPPLTRIMPIPSAKSKSKSSSKSRGSNPLNSEDTTQIEEEAGQKKGLLTVDEFREIFTEDYQVSQFWYSTPFSHKVSKLIKSLPFISSESIIVYISSPTLYVSHISLLGQSDNVFLFEYDQRFASIAPRRDGKAGSQFFKYDLNLPEKVSESLKGKVDLVVIDPPFLNEVTNEKMAKSVKLLLKSSSSSSKLGLGQGNGENGKVLLLTGLSIGDQAVKFYQDEKDPSSIMKRTKLEVEHESGLANPFGAWANFEDSENWGE